jgi:protein ImuB
MTRVVSLFLPHWATDRYKRESAGGTLPASGLVLAGSDGRRRVVVAADAPAMQQGLRAGMPLAKAQALVPGLRIEDAAPHRDVEALQRLAFWALRYSPVAAADPPDGIVLDVAGAAHLLGGEAALMNDLAKRLAEAGFACRLGVADTWGAAHAVARYGRKVCETVAPGASREALLSLPVAALRIDRAVVLELQGLGLEAVSDLISRPRAPTTLRFGPEPWRRIDQAVGTVAEPIDPVRADDVAEVRQSFAEPIGAAETIARYVDRLVRELCLLLETRSIGARRLDLLCERVDSTRQAVRIGTAMPTRDCARLSRMLRDKIEVIDPGFGIETMALAATLVQPLAAAQTLSSLVDCGAPDISDLVDILANRVVGERLFRMTPVQSDVPERSVERIPPLAPERGQTWVGGWPRPSRLLAKPEPIETVALLPDHPPASFTWRGVRRRVRRVDGPERVFGEWWRRDAELAAVRDYFRVEDEAGERYWIYRSGDGEDPATGSQRWFLHGIFG